MRISLINLVIIVTRVLTSPYTQRVLTGERRELPAVV